MSAQVRQPQDHFVSVCCRAIIDSSCPDLPVCRLCMGPLPRASLNLQRPLTPSVKASQPLWYTYFQQMPSRRD